MGPTCEPNQVDANWWEHPTSVGWFRFTRFPVIHPFYQTAPIKKSPKMNGLPLGYNSYISGDKWSYMGP